MMHEATMGCIIKKSSRVFRLVKREESDHYEHGIEKQQAIPTARQASPQTTQEKETNRGQIPAKKRADHRRYWRVGRWAESIASLL